MTFRRPRWVSRSAVATVLLAGALPLRAQSTASDAHALNTIFGDEYLATDVLGVCAGAADLPFEERYGFLADWVLPGEQHPTFRVVADFSPTYPAPTSKEPRPPGSGFRVPSGGEIISPARDLIDTAASLGRLEELRRRIEAAMTTSVGSHIDQLALLALVDVARGDVPSAKSNLSALFTLLVSDGTAEPPSNDAALLCVDAAAGRADLSVAVVEPAYRIVAAYQGVVERSVWQRQFSAAFARVRQAAGWNGDDSDKDAATGLARWFPASLPRARYRGDGAPAAQWITSPGRAENFTSHDEDFLYFVLPLRGNFEVESDVTSFSYRRSQLLVAGKWVGPVSNHKLYDLGDIDGSTVRFPIDPPMTKVDDYIHVRMVTGNGRETTYVNGRRMHDRTLPAEHDPWLAVHSAARHNGGVRNLRITGDPIVPATVSMTHAGDLTGWIPYFDEPATNNWSCQPGGSGEVHARHRHELPRGCHQESALFYHRPMLEDGSIQFEFWYDPGVCEAHPALDRLCFLLQPDGVKVHWLTDGPFDRTEMMPDNLIDEPRNRRGSGALPLHERTWNDLQLTVHGETVDVALNGELVCQRRLDPTNQRNFGLFHYADQTGLRVRNVTWRGDWPRSIPRMDDQELAIDETGFLDERLPELTAVFSHDFAMQGWPTDQFTLVYGDPATDLAAGPDGLHATQQAVRGYQNVTIAANLRVRGDFDITASFDQLVMEPRGSGNSSINLLAMADNATADECQLVRRWTLAGNGDRHIIQWVHDHQMDGGQRRHTDEQAMESRAGTFRLARRGNRVFYLFAENDSQQFRLIGRDAFPADALQMQGVRLKTQIYGRNGATSVVWKNLTIRAEGLSGPAFDEEADLLLNLDREP